MTLDKMYEWLGAVEYLIYGNVGYRVENDFGDMIAIGNAAGRRYEKFNRSLEFCGSTNSAAEAILWLYENNAPAVVYGDKGMCYKCQYKTDFCQEGLHCIRDSEGIK